MPASRSGARELADLEKLVGQDIECRITKLDTASEDVVVDRRVVLEERERADQAGSFREAAGRRCGARHRAHVDRFRRVRRSGRRRRIAARLRHDLRARREAVRRGDAGSADRRQDSQDQSRDAQDFAGAEATGARSVDGGGGEVSGGLAHSRQGFARCRFRRVRRTGAGHRRPDSRFRDVLDPQECPRGGCRQAGRHGRGGGAGRQRSRQAHCAGTEAGAGRSVGRGA